MSNKNVSKTTLPLATVIGKAVSQCAEAQQASAAATWEYIREIAFDPKNPKEVAMLQFDFVAQHKRLKIRLPLISVLPVQYVQIRDVEIDFNVDVDRKNAAKKDTAAAKVTRSLSKTSLTRLSRICPVRLAPSRMKVQKDSDGEDGMENHIRIKIKAGNMEMSGGMARILELAGSRGIRINPREEIAET